MHPRFRLFLLVSVSAVLAASCGGEEAETCFKDTDCDAKFECQTSAPGQPGSCVACPADEIPYDGQDNDCDRSTPDFDLDGDGDNSVNAPNNPGGDCDDMNPLVSSLATEACSDMIDNDCDGETDEEDCDDRASPEVSFISPPNGTVVRGFADFVVRATDDRLLQTLELLTPSLTLGTIDRPNPAEPNEYSFRVDTTLMPDGMNRVIARATDISGKDSEAQLSVIVDNEDGPVVSFIEPLADAAHGGMLRVTVDAQDPSGVNRVEIKLGIATRTTSMAPYSATFDTRFLPDGPIVLEAIGYDGNDAPKSTTINLNIDNSPPVVTLSTPDPNNPVVSGTSPIVVDATDLAGISRLEAPNQMQLTGAMQLSFDLDTTSLANGGYPLLIEAEDRAIINMDEAAPGNVGTTTITLDVQNNGNNPPAISWIDPYPNGSVYRRHLLQISVDMGTVRQMDFFVDGVLVGTDAGPPWEMIYDFSETPSPAQLEVRARDSQGAQSTLMSTVEVVAPVNFIATDTYPAAKAIEAKGYDIADLDGDGNLDVATCGKSLSVLFGTASGRLGPGRELYGSQCGDVAIVDYDENGTLDLVFVQNNQFERFLGDGMGGFTAEPRITLPFNGAAHIEAGNIDADASPELVIGLGGGGSLDYAVAEYEAVTGWSFQDSMDGTGDTAGLHLWDVDADGDLDIVMPRNTPAVTIYGNDGTGAFGAGVNLGTGAATRGVAMGHFNGDTRPDLAVVLGNGDVTIFESTNPGIFFSATLTFSVGSAQIVRNGVAAHDFDNDGFDDLVLTDGQISRAVLMRNDQAGDFVPERAYIMCRSNRAPLVRDFDGDGTVELIASSAQNDGICIAKGLGGFDFRAVPTGVDEPATRPAAIATGDFSPGGNLDVASAESTSGGTPGGRIRTYSNAGGVLTETLELTGTVVSPATLTAGDLDGINGPDLVAGSFSAGAGFFGGAQILLSNGLGGFSILQLDQGPTLGAEIADVDNNGTPEAVVARRDAGAFVDNGPQVLTSNGTELFTETRGTDARAVAVADFDNNPTNGLEFIVGNEGSDDLSFYFWNGSAHVGTSFAAGLSPLDVASGDMDGDGLLDVLLTDKLSTGIMRGIPNPQQILDQPIVFNTGAVTNSYVASRASDFNNDGYMDYATIDKTSFAVILSIARPEGAPNCPRQWCPAYFQGHYVNVGSTPLDIELADMSGDGVLDIVVGSLVAVEVVVTDP